MKRLGKPLSFGRPLWHLIDAKDQVVGRLSTQIVNILRAKVAFTGNKYEDKDYIWHTGFVGGLKRRSVKEELTNKPEEVLRRSVLGMLAKNTLRNTIAKKLRIFPGESHLHEDKLPVGTESILENKKILKRFKQRTPPPRGLVL